MWQWELATCHSHYHQQQLLQNSTFWGIAFRRRFCKSFVFPAMCHFFGFGNINFCTELGRQPWVQHPTRRTRSLYLCPAVTGWPQLNPQASGSIFIVFYDSQAYDGLILIHLHTGWLHVILTDSKYWAIYCVLNEKDWHDFLCLSY
jgi:hypothetical protein